MRMYRVRSMFTVAGTAVFSLLFVWPAVFVAPEVFAQSVSRPMIGMTLRGVTDGTVQQGEAMYLNVQLNLDDSEPQQGTVVLAPESGTWADAVTVTLVDNQGNPTGIQAQLFGKPDTAFATLDKDRIAGGLWRFKSGATSSLSPGAYALRVRLAIKNAASGSNGWAGEVVSEDLPLEIVAPSDSPERRSQSAMALAQEAILDDRLQDAAAGLDALLEEQRDNVQAWTLRAVVAERAGNIFGALACVNEAQTYYNALKLDEPDTELNAILRRLMKAIEEARDPQALSAPLGHWSWPPNNLLLKKDLSPPPEMDGVDAISPSAEKLTSVSAAAPVTEATVVSASEAVEADFLADPRGQWAVDATASSEYGTDRYAATHATGAPDVAGYSDNPNAWCHSGRASQEEWLEVRFAQPVRAGELRVRQSYTPGTIAKVEAFSSDGTGQVLWEGVDPNSYPAGQISWFVLRFPPPDFSIERVKLTLNISRVPGWKQIDAVQLVVK